ncbi:protein kinase family protein [Bacillaceae bacterium SIJ1]|uniref:serine/threonine protein kinase n=1 Tax=Litoribacterium kuwaitense TaxID=1398745 RepID=UPI0013EB1962|nr:protein kinase family protein [Litoribacterium kuwaitense]NGP45813.1 protein kinase family protein [Litoribacterium kuwaitense]
MSLGKKQNRLPRNDETIIGKWNGHRYRVLRLIGRGATGSVYLVERRGVHFALKISNESMNVSSEVNALRHFSHLNDASVGPELIDVDDWTGTGGPPVPFYVMEYIQGVPFLGYVQDKGSFWLGVLIVQLLADLEHLHRGGWVFGDLKPDNLIVTSHPPKARLLDVGGTTKIGRAVKEYTEFYDRGYWGCGLRKAEPTYDLFSIGMIMIHALYGRRFPKKEGEGLQQLTHQLASFPPLYQRVIKKALNGTYSSAADMKKELSSGLSEKVVRQAPKRARSHAATRRRPVHTSRQNKQVRKKKTKKKLWKTIVKETLWIGVILSALYVCILLLYR